MDSSSKFFFSFSVNYVMIVKLVYLIVLLGSKLLNRFRKFSTILVSEPSLIEIQITNLGFMRIWVFSQLKLIDI